MAENLNSLAVLLTAFGGLLSAVSGLNIWQYFKNRKGNKKLKEEIKADIETIMDKNQNMKLEEHESVLQKIVQSLETITGKIDEQGKELQAISLKVVKLEEHQERHEVREILKQNLRNMKKKINTLVYTYLADNKVTTAFESLLIKGGEESGVFFSDLADEGFENMNLQNAKKRSRAIMRVLRSQNTGNTTLSIDFLDVLKLEVVEPMLTTLFVDLTTFKTGSFGDRTQENYEKIVLSFISNFLSRCFEKYNTYYKL